MNGKPHITTAVRGEVLVVSYAEPREHCQIDIITGCGRHIGRIRELTRDDLERFEQLLAETRARMDQAQINFPRPLDPQPIPHEERLALEASFDGPIPLSRLYRGQRHD